MDQHQITAELLMRAGRLAERAEIRAALLGLPHEAYCSATGNGRPRGACACYKRDVFAIIDSRK